MAKMTIFGHVANGRQGSPRFKRDPRVGWDELEPNRSYLSHFRTWYSKLGHFPIEIPIKNENGWYPIVFLVCGPIIPIRMGSPSFEAIFRLWGKTEHPNEHIYFHCRAHSAMACYDSYLTSKVLPQPHFRPCTTKAFISVFFCPRPTGGPLVEDMCAH